MHVPPITLPPAFLDTLEALARDTWGRAAPEGSALAAAVRDVSHHYNHDRERVADMGGQVAALTARLRFFLPRDVFKIWGPLSELGACGGLPEGRSWRVLDVGAGLGTTTLGVASFAAATGASSQIEALAIDRDSKALAVMDSLLSRRLPLPAAKVRLQTQVGDVASLGPVRGPFDLVVAGLSLNELVVGEHHGDETVGAERMLSWIDGAAQLLAPSGAMIILEPALKQTSRVLQRVRDRLQATNGPPHLFAPCLGIASCPLLDRERDWCHVSIPFQYPEALGALAKASGLRQSDPTFSYLTLRTLPGTLSALTAPGEAPARVVGGPIRSKGKLELDLCGAGRFARLISLDRHRDKRSDVLAEVTRGTVLSVPEQVLAPEQKHLRLPQGVLPKPLL